MTENHKEAAVNEYSIAVWIIVGIVTLVMAVIAVTGWVCGKAAVDKTDNAQQ
jgi:flagellar basal body-associated protein FliL